MATPVEAFGATGFLGGIERAAFGRRVDLGRSATPAEAGEIATNAPLTVKAVKATVGEIVKDRTDRDMARIDQMIGACFDSQDYAEGRTAFMEKRKPVFTGR